jgi:hypothetical protein
MTDYSERIYLEYEQVMKFTENIILLICGFSRPGFLGSFIHLKIILLTNNCPAVGTALDIFYPNLGAASAVIIDLSAVILIFCLHAVIRPAIRRIKQQRWLPCLIQGGPIDSGPVQPCSEMMVGFIEGSVASSPLSIV